MKSRYIIFILFAASCVEPYEFRITNQAPALVVEAFISDKSYNETLAYPSDGRYFSVKLSKTSDVINVRPEKVQGAYVTLMNDLNETWIYTESLSFAGEYLLLDPDFKAEENRQYKLSVMTGDGETYESSWERITTTDVPAMGDIGFTETQINNGKGAVPTRGVIPNVSVPENNTGGPIYYRWQFAPTWIWVAPMHYGPYRTCWASSPYYIINYATQLDDEGGYKKDLIFLKTDLNERILEEFSLLVIQHSLSEDNYYFWKEMQDRNQGKGIFDNPPYNLNTNFTSLNEEKKVYGFFGVVGEQAKRWYFNTKDLSYSIPNTLFDECSTPCGPGCPPPNCFNCLRYEAEFVTNIQPTWWGR